MSNELARLGAAQFATRGSAPTAEARFWRRYRDQVIVNEYAGIGCVDVCTSAPHDFAVASSTRVQIYSSRTRAIARTVSRFSDVVHSAALRGDGRLLVAGDATGLVQVFDAASRSILKSIDTHKLPTHCVKFSPHGQTTLLTASDDKTVRVWDLAGDAPRHTFKGHDDYIRTAACMPNSPDLYISGAYDGTVRLWDGRVRERGGEVGRLRHEANVECVLPLGAGGGTIASGGGLQTRIWDLVAMSAQPLRTLQNHARGVTTLSLNGAATRLISGGLDGHLKIYDTTTWNVVHGVRYPSAIMTARVTPDDRHLIVGMSSGVLSLRTRSKRASTDTPAGDARRKASKTVQRFLRGAEYNPQLDPDPVVRSALVADDNPRTDRHKALKPWDRALRKYAYADALDLVLPPSPDGANSATGAVTGSGGGGASGGKKKLGKLSADAADPAIVYAVLHDLKRRSGLRQALSNRDELSLEPLLRWLVRYLSDPRMQGLVIDVGMCLLDVYGGALGAAPSVERLVDRFREKVADQVHKAKQAVQVQGALQMLVHASTPLQRDTGGSAVTSAAATPRAITSA